MVSLRTILSKKMPTGSQPEEPFDAMAFAHQQTEWYNNAEGHLDQEDGYDCPICRNKGYLRVVTEEGGIPNAWMRRPTFPPGEGSVFTVFGNAPG